MKLAGPAHGIVIKTTQNSSGGGGGGRSDIRTKVKSLKIDIAERTRNCQKFTAKNTIP